MRQVVLDTETTGLEPEQGHRIIEIGCVEIIDRRLSGNTWHRFLNPQREIDEAAIEVHGITAHQLKNEALFTDIAGDLIDFIRGAELIIHNAPFDVSFLNCELGLCAAEYGEITEYVGVLDTLVMARQKHPGQKNNLDALCKRYHVDNSQRTLHGALLDAEILADVYLLMTGGQMTLFAETEDLLHVHSMRKVTAEKKSPGKTPFIRANECELAEHSKWIELLDSQPGGKALWHLFDENQ